MAPRPTTIVSKLLTITPFGHSSNRSSRSIAALRSSCNTNVGSRVPAPQNTTQWVQVFTLALCSWCMSVRRRFSTRFFQITVFFFAIKASARYGHFLSPSVKRRGPYVSNTTVRFITSTFHANTQSLFKMTAAGQCFCIRPCRILHWSSSRRHWHLRLKNVASRI